MMKIAEDDNYRLNLCTEAKNWAKNFDWNKSFETFYNLIGTNIGQEILKPTYAENVLTVTEKA